MTTTWARIYAQRAGLRYWPTEPLLRFLARHQVGAGHRVLEVGCGNGSNTWALAETGADVTAIDGSAEALLLADDYLATRGTHAQLVELDLTQETPSGPYDVVVDVQTLQHLPNEAQVYERLVHALTPGGRLFSVHLGRGTTYERLYPACGPCSLPTAEEFQGMLRGLGLDVIVDAEMRTDVRRSGVVKLLIADAVKAC